MSFFKKLFGGGSAPTESAPLKAEEYKGFMIAAAPYKDAGQWQLAGVITKEIDGAMKEHKFVRADRFTDRDEAASIALSKARQIVDEQGASLFR
jgi:hypothetical protein